MLLNTLDETLSFNNTNKKIYYYRAKLIKDGHESLNDESWNEIRGIANLCPLEFGSPVQYARSILLDYLGESEYPENDALCNGEIEERRSDENSMSNNVAFSIYPNPSSGLWQIKFEDLEKLDPKLITVRDRLGKICLMQSMKTEGTNTTLNMSEYQPGIYFVEVLSSDNKINRAKLVLIK